MIYILMNNLNFSYAEAYNLPIWKRTWFIQRLIKEEKEKSNEQTITPQKENKIFKKILQ